jgi:hypothetical protein
MCYHAGAAAGPLLLLYYYYCDLWHWNLELKCPSIRPLTTVGSTVVFAKKNEGRAPKKCQWKHAREHRL